MKGGRHKHLDALFVVQTPPEYEAKSSSPFGYSIIVQ